MTQLFRIHPENPQLRLLRAAAALLQDGGVLAAPTDTSYALLCGVDDKDGLEKLRRIRQLDSKHLMSLVCRDLSELATYARVNNTQYRLLRMATPGPFTFILHASKEVPRRIVNHPRRKTIGLRVPEHRVLQELIGCHGAPLLATTLIMPGEDEPLHDAATIQELLAGQIEGVIESGSSPGGLSTVIDLSGPVPEVQRQGLGDAAALGLQA